MRTGHTTASGATGTVTDQLVPAEMGTSYLVRRLERAIRIRLDVALKPLAVSTPQYTVLSVLAFRGGLSSAQLARRAFVSPQAMNELVIGLEESGFIVRTPSQDNRKKLLCHLTDRGRTLFAACDAACVEVESKMLGALADEDLAQFRASLMSGISAFRE